MKARDLEIRVADRSEIKEFIENNHYSKSINGVKSTVCFAVEYNDNIVGAVLYGQMSTTAWKKFGKKESEVLELRRLCIVDEAKKNSESRVIGWTIRWIKKNLPGVKVIVSYADPNYEHTGVIYKASNFELIGVSGNDKGFKDKETGKIYHSRSLRVKYKGKLKPFAQKLVDKLEAGLLEPINLLPKYCYVYRIRK